MYTPSRRGTGRPFRRGTFTASSSPRYSPWDKREPTEEELLKGTIGKIDTIEAPSPDAGVSADVSIKGFETVASYSWQDQQKPTIIVPGCPPVWRNRAMPYVVARDSGTVYTDQNAARLSASPLLPMISAVSHFAPEFHLADVDFVTDRNGLRKLWRWAVNDPKAGTFRIDIDMVGEKTILMQRWDLELTQQGGPGYEKEFEAASTTPGPGCELAVGHHRIISYDLDGLKMLVRYKADACLPTEATKTPQSTKSTSSDPFADLISGIGRLSVSSRLAENKEVKEIKTSKGTLQIVSGGNFVPQSSLVELKTRSIHNAANIDWAETYPQLLLSQTPTMFVCIHERGTFQQIDKKTLHESELESYAREAQDGLRLLRKILGTIQDIALDAGDGAKLSLICRKGVRTMDVCERKEETGLLPKEVLDDFEL
ncbi:hypothetical protein M422DRAFT_226958 [Sphaerobolus stellatus SS14]|uniref:Geranylgeranyl pyrophosphate synthetase n=1 Tax=Sphaerobolus stellatus (strain SS14) TaxID=990650 RepID=A0A0C9VG24_SPHS4|nr:hypothetical protein M422DRAFT_226958 [Sphaerobolus stellatus SS14]